MSEPIDELDNILYACRLGFTVPDGKQDVFAEMVDHEDKYVKRARASIQALIQRKETEAREQEHNYFAGAIFALQMVGESLAAETMLESLKKRKAELHRRSEGGE